jgi:antitoxin VapB
MALNIKNPEVERLDAEVAELAYETKTEAIRRALAERKASLEAKRGNKKSIDLLAYLERHVWPYIPPEVLGKPLTKEEEEEILGIGPEGF